SGCLPFRSGDVDKKTGRVGCCRKVGRNLSHDRVPHLGVVNVRLHYQHGPLLPASSASVGKPRHRNVTAVERHDCFPKLSAISAASWFSKSISSSVQGLSS